MPVYELDVSDDAIADAADGVVAHLEAVGGLHSPDPLGAALAERYGAEGGSAADAEAGAGGAG